MVDRYVAALATAPFEFGRDLKYAAFVTRHPSMMGFVDGGLAILHPDSTLRWKLNVMTAILEASPEHRDAYLPASRRWPYAAYAGAVAVRAAFRGALGLVVVASIR